MNQNQTDPKPAAAEQDSGKGLDGTPCSASSLSRLLPGTHPAHVTKLVRSLQGGVIKLTAAVSDEVDVWGQIGGRGNPLYLPRNSDKSIVRFGGVAGYLNSPERGLLHHITVGQYLAFVQSAILYFSPNVKRTCADD